MGRTLTVTLRLTLTQECSTPLSPFSPLSKCPWRQEAATCGCFFCKFRTFCRPASNVTFFSGVRFWHAASRLISVTESWQFDKFQINRLLHFWNQSQKQMIPMIKVPSRCLWHLQMLPMVFFVRALSMISFDQCVHVWKKKKRPRVNKGSRKILLNGLFSSHHLY